MDATDHAGDSALMLEAYATGPVSDMLLAFLRTAAADDTLPVIGAVALPADESVMCLFATGSEESVRAFAVRRGLTTIRIVSVRWLVPSDGHAPPPAAW